MENIAINITADKLSVLLVPFIAPLKDERGMLKMFTVVKEINEYDLVFYSPEYHPWRRSTVRGM